MSGKSQPGKVFISYRRADTLEDARKLKQLLSERFGAANVFLDEKNIETGDQWATTIKQFLDVATAVIVLMGPDWSDRLKQRYESSDSTDWVRLELARAIERIEASDPLVLMPLLINGANPPNPVDFKPELRGLLEKLSAFQCGTYCVDNRDSMAQLERELVLKGGMRNESLGQSCLDSCGQKLKNELAKATLKGLREAWPNPPLQPKLADSTFSSFQDFVSAMARVPKPDPSEKTERNHALRQVAGLLLQMCADYGRLCIWSSKHSRLAWPTQSAGVAASLKGATLGLSAPPVIQEAVEPELERVHRLAVRREGLGAMDEGIKQAHRLELAQSIIENHRTTASDSSLTGSSSSAAKLKYAKLAVQQGARKEAPHFLAELVDKGNLASELAHLLAQEFDLPLVPYELGDQDLFRQVDNDEVYLEFKDALDAIATHTA